MVDIQEKSDAINAFASLIKQKEFTRAAEEYYAEVQEPSIDGILKSYNIVIDKYKKRKEFDAEYEKQVSSLDEGYIDINYYKLKFEINQIIKIIRKKINMNYIILNDEEKNILNNKFINLLNNIYNNNITTQKMLDIKNTLKTKFFID